MSILLKALSRNSGIVFEKYSQWVLSEDVQVNQNIHHKFLGAVMINILRENKDDETLMFKILPVIAQSLNGDIDDLKLAGLLSIG
jgi:hypothetical protein